MKPRIAVMEAIEEMENDLHKAQVTERVGAL